MTQFEYTEVESLSCTMLLELINQKGQDGWELISVLHVAQGIYIAILKRKIVKKEEIRGTLTKEDSKEWWDYEDTINS